MAQLQTLVITDRTTPTAVNYTLLPVNEEGGVGTVAVTDASGAQITETRFSIARRVLNGKRARSTLKLYQPIIATEVVNGVSMPKIVDECFFDGTITFGPTVTEVQRNNFMGLLESLFKSTKPLVHDTVVKGSNVY